jgi:hypothetical protein
MAWITAASISEAGRGHHYHGAGCLSLENAPIVAHSIGGHWSLWTHWIPGARARVALLGVPATDPHQTTLTLRLMSVPASTPCCTICSCPGSRIARLRSGLSGAPPETLASLPEAMAECYYIFNYCPIIARPA